MSFSGLRSSERGEVLIVDDSLASLRLLSDLLINSGYVVREAPNGEQALWTIKRHAPDIILLDIRMPILNGFEVCRRLKSDPATAAIPVIFLSALTDIDDRLEGFSVGGVDFISKPFALEEVLARVNTHITLMKVTQDLKRAVADLSEFNYVVSHDLRSPLRHLSGFLEMMNDELTEQDADNIKPLLRRCQHSVARMSNMIAELLRLAAVGQSGTERTKVDLSDVVDELLAELAIDKTAVHFTVEPIPPVRGDPLLLRQVMQNLLDNALKYSSKKPDPRIYIGGRIDEMDPDFVIIDVKDNGVGFDQQYASKLFKLFQRLHLQEDFPGTGVGLSFCAKVAALHGGSIAAKGEMNVGAEFCMRLPGA